MKHPSMSFSARIYDETDIVLFESEGRACLIIGHVRADIFLHLDSPEAADRLAAEAAKLAARMRELEQEAIR